MGIFAVSLRCLPMAQASGFSAGGDWRQASRWGHGANRWRWSSLGLRLINVENFASGAKNLIGRDVRKWIAGID